MKFKLRQGWRKTVIMAETEHEEEKFGHKAQSPFPEVHLTGSQVVFEHRIRDIHPDLLGLLCMVMFYPFCKKTVTFPKSVSVNFQRAFSEEILPLYQMVDGHYKAVKPIEITNVDHSLKPYSGERLAVSFGGGFDSMAVQLLFPEAVVVHESFRLPDGSVKKDRVSDYLKKLQKDGSSVYNIINNQRYGLSNKRDWNTWPASAANAILLATDLNIGYIMNGGTIDSKFLNHHGRFYKAASPGQSNPWNRAFEMIGLKYFSPVWGISEASTMKIVNDNGRFDFAIYCDKDNGYPCHRCSKCFRKNVYASALGIKKFNHEYWERYNTDEIKEIIYRKPVHASSGYAYGLRHLSHIDWMYEVIRELPDTSHWMLKYYRGAFQFMPCELAGTVEERISRYCKPVDDPSDLESWDAMTYYHQVKR